MKNSRTDIDHLFEQGVSEVSRAPRKTLSDEQIKTAAAASTSGAGVWLLAHAKEMLIGVVSFAAGCLVMIAVLHSSVPKSSEQQRNADVAEVQVVGVDNDIDIDLGNQGKGAQTTELSNSTSCVQPTSSQITNPTSNVTRHTSRLQTSKSQVQSPKSQEPVVIKKTVVQRDTVVINETVIFKDTVYVP